MSSIDFNYTAPPTVAKFMRSNAFHRAMMGPIGCVSADTEYLTPTGWKRIDAFVQGDQVAQWENGVLSFVEPEHYLVKQCENLIWFYNSSLSMQLSDEHRVPVYDWSGKFRVKLAKDLAEKPSRHKIPTTFIPIYSDAPVSDEEIRLAVAVNADGHHQDRGSKTIICVRKERKKERIRFLFSEAGVEYTTRSYLSRPTEVNFVFTSEYKGKTYEGWHWWNLSQRQLQIVVDEMQYWDGLFEGPDSRFHSKHRSDADFIQYAVHAIGGKASISVTEYPTQSTWAPTYIVHIAQPGSIKAVATLRVDSVNIERVSTVDGKKYCFTVPSGFFLARHNGFIFVTGNSGKSVGMCVEILRRNLEMPAWNRGKRSSKWAIIRNTNKQLRDTTLATWMHWMRDLGTWHESKMTFRMRFGEVDSEILFLPLDTPDDVGRVLSLELTGAWVNEFREVPIPLLADLKGRLRRYPNPSEVPDCWYGLISDTNPPEIDSPAYKLMEHLPQEEGNDNSIIVADTFKQPSGLAPNAENTEHLHPDYYKDLAKGQTKAWVDTYIHGLYSPSQSGKPVYDKIFRPEKHVSTVPLKIEPFLPVVIGFDCGLTPAAVFYQMDLSGRVRILREAVEFDMGMKRFAKLKLRPIIKNFFPTNPIIFIGDPAGKRRADSDESTAFKAIIGEFDDDDVIVKAASTNDPKVRIQATESLLSQYPEGEPLLQIDPSCRWYIEALRSKYRYPKQKMSGIYSDNPEKNEWSHVAEAGQYGALYLNSGKFDPSDFTRASKTYFDPLNHHQAYRPAQREGY